MKPEVLLRELKGIETRLANMNRQSEWHPAVQVAIAAAKSQVARARYVAEQIRATVQNITPP